MLFAEEAELKLWEAVQTLKELRQITGNNERFRALPTEVRVELVLVEDGIHQVIEQLLYMIPGELPN